MLQRDLPGYANYAARVRYRLMPGSGSAQFAAKVSPRPCRGFSHGYI